MNEVLEHHILDHVKATINLFGVHVSITEHMILMWIVSILMLVLFPVLLRLKGKRVYSAFEAVVLFVRDEIVISTMGESGKKYTPYFCTLFFMILLLNLIGMIPYSKTATGNISITFGFALTTFLLVNFMGIKSQGVKNYMKSFVPEGLPGFLNPFIFVLEVLSLITKTIALAVRLFANMIAGHTVIICFISLIFIIAKMNVYFGIFTIFPSIIMSLFVSLLEILIIFIQAFIFTFLTALFTGTAMSSSH